MDEASITRYITDTFDRVDCLVAAGDTFFYYGTDRKYPLPFATIVTKDYDHDRASHLDRPSVFRLNIGVGKRTFRSLFGSQPSGRTEVVGAEAGPDFAALDQLLPHPVYGRMYWVCVLNPGAATFETVRTLLAEAYELAAGKRANARPADES